MRAVELPIDIHSGRARRRCRLRARTGSRADGQCALIVVLVAVEHHVDAVVFEELRDRAHLSIEQRRISGGEGRLVEHDHLPELLAGIQIVDHPLSERRRVGDEGRRRGVEGRSARQVVVEQVGIGVQEQEVRVAVIERIVALMVDLLRRYPCRRRPWWSCATRRWPPARCSRCPGS